jgi:hypothetical protein
MPLSAPNYKNSKTEFCTILLAFLAFACAPFAHADTLDWQAQAWTAGALNNGAGYVINGTTVTVTISGQTADLITFSGVTAPDDSTLVDGGTGEEALYLGVDHDNRDTDTITVTVSFSRAVTINSFSIFDIDTFNTNSFQDQIRNIQATLSGGGTVYGNLTATDPAYVTVSGSGTAAGTFTAVLGAGGSGGAGNNTDDGTGTINFGTSSITSFQFTYGNGSGSIADPTSQHVALGDITFTVPEPSTYLSGLLLVSLVAVQMVRRKQIGKNLEIA